MEYVLELPEEEIVEVEPEVIEEEESPAYYLEVTNSFLNVRSYPDTSSDENLIGTLYLGDRVQWINRENGWYTIIFEGQEAYVAEQYVIEIYE